MASSHSFSQASSWILSIALLVGPETAKKSMATICCAPTKKSGKKCKVRSNLGVYQEYVEVNSVDVYKSYIYI